MDKVWKVSVLQVAYGGRSVFANSSYFLSQEEAERYELEAQREEAENAGWLGEPTTKVILTCVSRPSWMKPRNISSNPD